MAMGWKNGVMPALCNGERCLDKSWLCLLAHLPCSGAAASVFQARMGGEGVSAHYWKSPSETDKESWENLISLLRQMDNLEDAVTRKKQIKSRAKPNQTKPNLKENGPMHI